MITLEAQEAYNVKPYPKLAEIQSRFDDDPGKFAIAKKSHTYMMLLAYRLALVKLSCRYT